MSVPGESPELAAMVRAARTAGSGLMRRFQDRAGLRVDLKGLADFVSSADIEAEQTVREILLSEFPSFGLLAEEGGATGGGDASRFVVDPLDGTTNFLHGVAHFAVSIALERDGRTTAGVVFDPAKGELFSAQQGRGAWLGSERLRVADDADLARSIVGTGIPHSNAVARHGPYLRRLRAVMEEAAGIRRFGAAALDLAYVAAGRFAAYFEFGLKPWDLAAGALLVREAGGRVTDPCGGDDGLATGDVLASNGCLHEALIERLQRGPTHAG